MEIFLGAVNNFSLLDPSSRCSHNTGNTILEAKSPIFEFCEKIRGTRIFWLDFEQNIRPSEINPSEVSSDLTIFPSHLVDGLHVCQI